MTIVKNILGIKVSLAIVILCFILFAVGGVIAYSVLKDSPKPLPFLGDTSPVSYTHLTLPTILRV